jgi:hypothetical protein
MFVFRNRAESKMPGTGKQRAHRWDEDRQDTVCKMWSTGGIRKRETFVFSDDAGGRQICAMCQVNDVKRQSLVVKS